MIKILKNSKPGSLLMHKKSGGDYNSISADTKKELRESLIEEQGFVCCYCLKRIPENKMDLNHTKIEHFKCQKKYPHLDLEYSNLHLACKGKEGNSRKNQTCDTAKGDKEINHFSLIDNSLHNNIFFAVDGTIFSKYQSIDKEINDVLQLNNDQTLRKARKNVIKGLSNVTRNFDQKGKLTKNKLKRELRSWKHKKNHKYKEFYPVAIQYLEKKIRRFNAG